MTNIIFTEKLDQGWIIIPPLFLYLQQYQLVFSIDIFDIFIAERVCNEKKSENLSLTLTFNVEIKNQSS